MISLRILQREKKKKANKWRMTEENKDGEKVIKDKEGKRGKE